MWSVEWGPLQVEIGELTQSVPPPALYEDQVGSGDAHAMHVQLRDEVVELLYARAAAECDLEGSGTLPVHRVSATVHDGAAAAGIPEGAFPRALCQDLVPLVDVSLDIVHEVVVCKMSLRSHHVHRPHHRLHVVVGLEYCKVRNLHVHVGCDTVGTQEVRVSHGHTVILWEACRPEDIGFVRRIFEYLKLVDVFQDRTPVVRCRNRRGTTRGTRRSLRRQSLRRTMFGILLHPPGGRGVDPTH